MTKKYLIILTCITCIALVLGVSANLSYDDFNEIANYVNSESSFILSEAMLVKKVLSWLSVYSFEYHVDLRQAPDSLDDQVDYILIEDAPGAPILQLSIDGYDKQLGIYDDLRRLGNMLSHEAIPSAPEDPDLSDTLILIWIGVRTVVETVRYFSGVIYSIITILLNSLPMLLDILVILLYILGLIPTLY